MEQKTDVRDPDEKVVEIEMERLREFPNHPFKVIGDGQMIELQDSIKKYGVLNPLIVRPKIEGYYEIISGHRRKYAAEKLGYKKIPVIIRMMQNDEAVVIMVDSNSQRDQITPSEKAYEIKSGKHTAIRGKEQKRFIRFHLLGEEFSRLLSKKKIAYSEYKKRDAGLSDCKAKRGILLCSTAELEPRRGSEKETTTATIITGVVNKFEEL